MKAERHKAGIVSRALSVLTSNWELKLLALGLAVIVYHSLKTESLKDKDPNDRHLFQHR